MTAAFKPAPSLATGPYPERDIPAVQGWAALSRRFEQWLHGWQLNYSGNLARSALPTGLPVTSAMLQAVVQQWHSTLGIAPDTATIAAARLLCIGSSAVQLSDANERQQALCLAALTMASANIPVHLVFRDEPSHWSELHELAAAMGLTTATIGPEADAEARRSAYKANIVAINYRQLIFDYLCDRRLLAGNRGKLRSRLLHHRIRGNTMMRGLSCALVVEGSKVLIDASLQPIALAAPDTASCDGRSVYQEALECAAALVPETHFTDESPPRLTTEGEQRVASLAGGYGPLWRGDERARTLVRGALHAGQLVEGQDYSRHEAQLRLAPDFQPVEGLLEADYKNLLALRLGLEASAAQAVTQRISLQHFFVRYLHLATVGANLYSHRRELRRVYSLHCKVPSGRAMAQARVFADSSRRYTAVIQRLLAARQRNEELQLFCRDDDSREKFLSALAQSSDAGELACFLDSILLESDSEELLSQASSKFPPGLLAVDTPASLATEEALCAALPSGKPLEVFGSADESLFDSCGPWRRFLIPYSERAYYAARYQALEPQRLLRNQVAAQDAYIRQTLAFSSGGS